MRPKVFAGGDRVYRGVGGNTFWTENKMIFLPPSPPKKKYGLVEFYF